jgi:hypothetical protein
MPIPAGSTLLLDICNALRLQVVRRYIAGFLHLESASIIRQTAKG